MTGITICTTQTYSKPGFMTIKQPIRTLHTINKVLRLDDFDIQV